MLYAFDHHLLVVTLSAVLCTITVAMSKFVIGLSIALKMQYVIMNLFIKCGLEKLNLYIAAKMHFRPPKVVEAMIRFKPYGCTPAFSSR